MKNGHIFLIIDHRILIIVGSGPRKTNALINLINEQDNCDFIDKIYLYAKDLSKPKYQFLIKKREDAGIRHLNDPNAFIECFNTIDDIHKNTNDYNLSRKRKKLIVFHDMIADVKRNQKVQAIIEGLFIRCRKLNIWLTFITQSYFAVSKDVKLNSTHFLIMKINNRTELKNVGVDHFTDIDYKDLMKIYLECRKEPFNFLAIDLTLPVSDLLRFR